MKISKRAFLYILFCAFLISFPFKGEGSVGMSISPQKFDLVVFPGDTYQARFQLGNRSEIPLPVSVRAVPFGAEDGTGDMRFEAVDSESPSLWFDFKTPEVILEPGETRYIDFKVSVPSDANPGGYYVFVYFEPRIPSYYLEEMGPKAVPVVGVPFLISTTPLLLDPEEGEEFEVAEFSIPEEERALFFENTLENIRKSIISGLGIVFAESRQGKNIQTQIIRTQPSRFVVNIKNNDVYHIKPLGTLLIYNTFGDEIGRAELKGQTILPGRNRDFNIVLDEEYSDDSKSKTSSFLSSLISQILPHFISLGKQRADLDVYAISPVREKLLPAGGNPSIIFFSLNSLYLLFASLLLLTVAFLGRKRMKAAIQALVRRGNHGIK